MKVVIEKLTSELLQNQFGFIYDGFYWVKYPTPIRLTSAENGSFLVSLDGAGIGDFNPDPVESNCDLLKLIISLLPTYIQARAQHEQVTQLDPNIAAQWMNEYLNFPDNMIQLNVTLGPQGAGLSPKNEFTYTMLSGSVCEFKINWIGTDDACHEDIIYYNPVTISYRFIKSLLGDDCKEITNILVKADDSCNWEPFFGVGLI